MLPNNHGQILYRQEALNQNHCLPEAIAMILHSARGLRVGNLLKFGDMVYTLVALCRCINSLSYDETSTFVSSLNIALVE
jgi:hypothetical protein